MSQRSVLDFQKLKGRWVRPDGGYVIEIGDVDSEGGIEARYFNPMPIRGIQSRSNSRRGCVKSIH